MGERPGTGELSSRTDSEPNDAAYPDFSTRDFCRHLALFYDSVDQQLETIGQFVRHELGNDRRCVYLADANSTEAIEEAIAAANVDVERCLEAGDLCVESATDAYLDEGFDPERMIETLEGCARESVDADYTGLSVLGENTWCFHTGETFDDILQFEVDFDARYPELPITALCQYDLTEFSEASIAKALRTHEQVIYRDRLCDNPYYVPPSEYSESSAQQLNVQLMLEQLYGLSEANRQVERHEQRLSIVNRILRHNVRNELNVVLGNLALLEETVALGDEARDRLSAAEEHATQVVELAEKARFIEETIADPTLRPTELPATVEDVLDRLEADHPDVRFSVVGECDDPVVAVERIDVALLELAENAIRHQEADPPTVTFELAETERDVSVLSVRNPGEPIPDVDQEAVLTGRETATRHSRGLGLWIVKWLVENSHGSLAFTESEDGECVVRIELPNGG